MSIPTQNDKIILNIDGIGYIFKVYDVHYMANGGIDINLIKLSTTTEFKSSKFPDIK
ncbi:hypothetical protein [Aureispira sp. CCB-QB1]|uniref:hypothetical protein n=1 Tax=Aureispira sp. CCB-QB1 TaxID=1313421 RepID=UPI0012DEE28B|nr:hypothetical protein [Aureispira sp. CCB-QB1]